MPNGIVTEIKYLETCPEPECNLSGKDVEQFLEELNSYARLFASAFCRREQREWCQAYLNGLLGNTARKTAERMALEMGENVRDLQHFLGQSPWKKEPAVIIHQGLIAEALNEVDGVALIDETGNVKQGQDSVGVAPQYCGSVGKVANSQVGVDLGYVSRKGYTLLDSQLFMPEEWFDEEHAERRKACGVPEDLCYQTKPEIALKLLQALVERNKTLAIPLIFRWVAADALYGDSITFRDGVAALERWYFAAIKSTLHVWLHDDGALARRELRQRRENLLAVLVGFCLRFGRIAAGEQGFDFSQVAIQRAKFPVTTGKIQRGMNHAPEQVGFKGPGFVKVADVPVDFQEDILNHILGCGFVLQNQEGCSRRPHLIACNQRFQPADVAALKPLHGFLGVIHAFLQCLCVRSHKIYTIIREKVGVAGFSYPALCLQFFTLSAQTDILCSMQPIPTTLAPFFQEYTLAQLDPQRDAATIIERTLRFGTRDELRWLFSTYSREQITDWVRRWGKYALPEPHLSFWRLLLEVSAEQ